jgi:hypothetical protein
MPQEPELSGMRRFGQPVGPAQWRPLGVLARDIVESLWKDRFHPALVDGKPCQYTKNMTFWTTPIVEN